MGDYFYVVEIDGHWDRIATAKDIATGKITIIYNAKDTLSGLKTPFVKDPEAVSGAICTTKLYFEMDHVEQDANGNGDGNEAPAPAPEEVLPPPPPVFENVTPIKAAPEPQLNKTFCVPMARRSLGTKGNKVPILTNHLKVSMSNVDGFFHYSVAFFYNDVRPVDGKGS
ncbi:hypothetical protein CASFOL_019925 [Castilleja foliolosa]|uniref:Uncharacterized protein n=1 Tax=Castilleja foliolosa TaxID=1961234 RepID=A0ABD3CZD3_9LAMI